MGQDQSTGASRGVLNATGLHIGIVVSRFNSFITDRLLAGALDALEASGAGAEQIEIVRVPGSFEIPVIAKKLATGDNQSGVGVVAGVGDQKCLGVAALAFY